MTNRKMMQPASTAAIEKVKDINIVFSSRERHSMEVACNKTWLLQTCIQVLRELVLININIYIYIIS